MSDVITYIFIFFMAILGGLSTIYVVLALPAVLIWKVYRKIKFGEKIM